MLIVIVVIALVVVYVYSAQHISEHHPNAAGVVSQFCALLLASCFGLIVVFVLKALA